MTQQALTKPFINLKDLFVFDGTSLQPTTGIDTAERDILFAIGETPDRQGLVKTPERVARMYEELTAGYNTDPERLINGALFDVDYNEMVLVKDIEFYSLCEHHMLPRHRHAPRRGHARAARPRAGRPAPRRRFRGLGLGLRIATRLIEVLGGDLRVRSEADQGTQFIVTIPARAPAAPNPRLH